MDTSKEKASISDLLQQIRDLINIPRKQYILLEDRKIWYMLTSSMDVIGDTGVAIDAYLESIEENSDVGNLYLGLYGILQVLFVQQDAVEHLSESLGIEYTRDEELKQIRKIRNESIGHPTRKRERDKNPSFHYITRISMSRQGFRLMSARSGSEPKFSDVDIVHLISKQRENLGISLSNITEKLREEELDHRRQYRDQKLEDIFGQDLTYNFEKIGNVISAGSHEALGLISVDLVFEKVDKFKVALEERGLLKAHELEDFVEMASYSLSELRGYIDNPSSSRLNDKDAEIFYNFARRRLYELIDRAREFDEEYGSDSIDS